MTGAYRTAAAFILELGDAVTLKGGLAVELRIARARTTPNIGLRLMSSPDDIESDGKQLGRDEHPDVPGDTWRTLIGNQPARDGDLLWCLKF